MLVWGWHWILLNDLGQLTLSWPLSDTSTSEVMVDSETAYVGNNFSIVTGVLRSTALKLYAKTVFSSVIHRSNLQCQMSWWNLKSLVYCNNCAPDNHVLRSIVLEIFTKTHRKRPKTSVIVSQQTPVANGLPDLIVTWCETVRRRSFCQKSSL